MYKYVFLDFNGTIIDDVDLCLDLLNYILTKQNKKNLTKEEYKNVFTFPIKKYYQLAGVDFNLDSFEDLADWFIKEYQPKSLECSLYPNLIESFKILKQRGYHLVILSASEQNNLIMQCQSFDIVKYFDAILGINNIHASSKVDIAVEYVKKMKLDPKDILFVGDTLHDLEVSKAIGADAYLVSCGHQSVEVLKGGNVPIINNVSDLIGILK